MSKFETGEPMRYDRVPAITVRQQREAAIEKDQCPECGGELDTGWECNSCGFDALPELKNSPYWEGKPND